MKKNPSFYKGKISYSIDDNKTGFVYVDNALLVEYSDVKNYSELERLFKEDYIKTKKGFTRKNPCRSRKRFISRGNKRRVLRRRAVKPARNPGKRVKIYDSVIKIFAVKGKTSNYPGQKFVHSFKPGAGVYGNPDGSLTIRGNKPLWKMFKA